jgi:Rap1a immunity proteins
MRRWKLFWLVSIVSVWPLHAQAVTRDDFLVRATHELLALCTASESDPLYASALGFCQGFLVGVYQYHQAENAGPGATPFFCPPDPTPTREEAIKMFIAWAQANSQFQNDRPVDTIFRFLTTKWPCQP